MNFLHQGLGASAKNHETKKQTNAKQSRTKPKFCIPLCMPRSHERQSLIPSERHPASDEVIPLIRILGCEDSTFRGQVEVESVSDRGHDAFPVLRDSAIRVVVPLLPRGRVRH